jgi:hypothetical protein
MGSYYNQETGTLSLWDSKAAKLVPVSVKYADKDKSPGDTPWFPRPEYFPTFHAHIMEAFSEAKLEQKSDLYMVKNEVDDRGHLVWVFGRRDAENDRSMQFQIDDIGAAGQYNASPGTLKAYTLRELKALDSKKLGE